jgi:hypothetical protein
MLFRADEDVANASASHAARITPSDDNNLTLNTLETLSLDACVKHGPLIVCRV